MSQKTLSVTFAGRVNEYQNEGSAAIGYIIRREDTDETLVKDGKDISDRLYLDRVGPAYVEYCALIEALRLAKDLVDPNDFDLRIRSNNLSVLRCVNPDKHNSSIKLSGMVDDAQSELKSFNKPVEFKKISHNEAGEVAQHSHRFMPDITVGEFHHP